jgi:hypothetical protein
VLCCVSCCVRRCQLPAGFCVANVAGKPTIPFPDLPLYPRHLTSDRVKRLPDRVSAAAATLIGVSNQHHAHTAIGRWMAFPDSGLSAAAAPSTFAATHFVYGFGSSQMDCWAGKKHAAEDCFYPSITPATIRIPESIHPRPQWTIWTLLRLPPPRSSLLLSLVRHS